ncbi:dihydroflavonol-4-reductase [Cryobacterium mesophilum]|uniref:Aldehyde reductase n=1 Tax=Terrimesophilobacter mesophilus TaxID=433647 RepID=A0A4R8VBP0_9MICO|nr:aldehyde reductase [Terrimesophilobacter mesophilus]MBB5632718.1 dihydroflavonol-4-reductase [Terrimesophilobacter mesophilus]TFB79520.1 aldehyde reductase [Terrimesophilobacter mesophilus]
MSGERVLVTGGSGFVGVHCIQALLNAGYRVRTTVRSLDRDHEVRAMLAKAGAAMNDAPGEALEFRVADLLSDAGWADAADGCTYVLHVASPFPGRDPKDEDDLIRPAREGALRVLKAARDAGVKRVVLTSSFAAIGYGTKELTRPYTEDDWTDATANVSAYVKSKTLAERAAWDFMDREGGSMELSVVNPTAILGPVYGTDLSTSIELVRRLLNGATPGLPKVTFAFVDVRDVADLHVRAMTNPAAAGERFLATSDGVLTVPQLAQILRDQLGEAARKVSTFVLPNWMVRTAALFDPSLREIARRLGNHREVSNAKAKSLLGWEPHSNAELLKATAESLADLGLAPGNA